VGNAEGSQQYSLVAVVVDVSKHDVRRFDVAVQQTLLVRVVEGTRYRGDDVGNLVAGVPAG
jgi:hypothetical protein